MCVNMYFKILYNEFNFSLFVSYLAFVFSRFVEHAKESWIGLHKAGSKFVWSDNTTRDYEYWRPGFSRYSRLKCAAQVYSSDVAGKWKTYNCSKKLPFSCKITRVNPEKKSSFLGNCSDGWKKVEDRCLKYFSSYSDTGTWPESREKCKRYGGDLVTIDSEEIQSAIRYMIRNTWRPTWIGEVDILEVKYFDVNRLTETKFVFVYTLLFGFSHYYLKVANFCVYVISGWLMQLFFCE